MPDPRAERTSSFGRNVYVFSTTSFLNDTASEMAYWILPAFLASMGAGPAQLGLIEGLAESVASFAKLFSGYLADRSPRRKPLVVGGYFLANAVKPLLAFATSWVYVLGIRFADRLAKGIRGAPRDVMVAESVPQARLGSAYGLIQSMDTAGAIAGPLIALALMAHYGARGVFLAAAVPGALCFLVALFGVRETEHSAESKPAQAGSKDPIPATRLPLAFYLVLLAAALFSLGNSSDMFLVLRAQSAGVRVALAPLFGLVFNITYTLASWPAGWLSDRVPRRFLAAAGYLVFAVVYFVFGRAPSARALWITMAFYGLHYALTQPVLKALVVDAINPSVRGRALGIYAFVTSVATLAASLITGGLWKVYGAGVPFYFSAVLATAAAAILLMSGSARRSES